MIEQGAIWVPSWLRQMESAFEAFSAPPRRRTSRLSSCSPVTTCTASAGSRPTQPRTWVGLWSRQAPIWCCSRRTIPHVEGGRKPLERFEASLGDADADVRRRFYADNFLFLMGSAATALAA